MKRKREKPKEFKFTVKELKHSFNGIEVYNRTNFSFEYVPGQDYAFIAVEMDRDDPDTARCISITKEQAGKLAEALLEFKCPLDKRSETK